MVIVPVAFIAGSQYGCPAFKLPWNTTFLFSGNPTFLFGTYTKIGDNLIYVKLNGEGQSRDESRWCK
jgi:hypothetical protein